MATYASMLQDGMEFLTASDIAEAISIQVVSKTVDAYGDCSTTVTTTYSVYAVIQKYDGRESQIGSGLGVTNRPPGQFLDCQLIAYCNASELTALTHDQAMRGRVIYNTETYEVVDEENASIGGTIVYRALYLKRR